MSRSGRRSLLTVGILVTAVPAAVLVIRLAGQARLDRAEERFAAVVGPLEMSGYQLPELVVDLSRRLESRDWQTSLRRSFGAEGTLVTQTPMKQLAGESSSFWSRMGFALVAPW